MILIDFGVSRSKVKVSELKQKKLVRSITGEHIHLWSSKLVDILSVDKGLNI